MDKKFGVGEQGERESENLNNIPLSLTFHHLKRLFCVLFSGGRSFSMQITLLFYILALHRVRDRFFPPRFEGLFLFSFRATTCGSIAY
jgi:hypothetical protein